MVSTMHNYQSLESAQVRVLGKRVEAGLENQLLVIQTPFGYRRMGELFCPEGGDALAALLYVHWYEPDRKSTRLNSSH